MAGRGCCEGARRMVTILEVGRSCNAPILKVGVSCMDAISKEKVSCTAVCIAPAGEGAPPTVGVLITGAFCIWVGSGMFSGIVDWKAEGSVETTGGLNCGVSTDSCKLSIPMADSAAKAVANGG